MRKPFHPDEIVRIVKELGEEKGDAELAGLFAVSPQPGPPRIRSFGAPCPFQRNHPLSRPSSSTARTQISEGSLSLV